MTLDRNRIRALCFDVDGTLRDTDDQYVQRLAGWLAPLRFLFHQRNPQPFARRMVMALEDPATFLHGIPDRLQIDHYLARLAGRLDRLWQPRPDKQHFLIIPGVKEMLDHLHRHYPMAVISARSEVGTRSFLEHYGLVDYFQAVAGAQTCHYVKPFPDQILWAADKMGVAPDECLMIGDTTVDMRAGKAAGAQTVGVLCGFGEEAELRRTGADIILPATPDIASLLDISRPPLP